MKYDGVSRYYLGEPKIILLLSVSLVWGKLQLLKGMFFDVVFVVCLCIIQFHERFTGQACKASTCIVFIYLNKLFESKHNFTSTGYISGTFYEVFALNLRHTQML